MGLLEIVFSKYALLAANILRLFFAGSGDGDLKNLSNNNDSGIKVSRPRAPRIGQLPR